MARPARQFPFTLLPPDPHAAPTAASPTMATRRRARANPELPQPGESFADYTRRSDGAALGQFAGARGLSPTGERPARGQVFVDPRPHAWQARADRAERDRADRRDQARYGLHRIIGEAMVERYNEPTMNIEAIPLGQIAPKVQERGRRHALTYRMDSGRRPIGLIMWGQDTRRTNSELAADMARVTGAPAGYLERLAQRESGWRPDARAKTSSATGLTQFINSTWTSYVRAHGERYGLPAGMHEEDVLNLRLDPRWDLAMASEYARENATAFRRQFRRPPTERDLYLMHFAGQQVGLNAAAARQTEPANKVFGQAQIDSNPTIFFERSANGRRLRTIEEVRDALASNFLNEPAEFAARLDGSD